MYNDYVWYRTVHSLPSIIQREGNICCFGSDSANHYQNHYQNGNSVSYMSQLFQFKSQFNLLPKFLMESYYTF